MTRPEHPVHGTVVSRRRRIFGGILTPDADEPKGQRLSINLSRDLATRPWDKVLSSTVAPARFASTQPPGSGNSRIG
ncbi:hypothetical protein KC354_g102 [Hortaea werneckii]|nr:hypothetical protein KC354_g102 [Hortaea werneckii]